MRRRADSAQGGSSLQSSFGFWGAINDLPSVSNASVAVELYQCPNGYCCENTQGCCLNFCTSGREGVLCGRCLPGFSQAIFGSLWPATAGAHRRRSGCLKNSKCPALGLVVGAAIVVAVVFSGLLLMKDGAASGLVWHLFADPLTQSQFRVITYFYQVAIYVADISKIERVPLSSVVSVFSLLASMVSSSGGFSSPTSAPSAGVCTAADEVPTSGVCLMQ